MTRRKFTREFKQSAVQLVNQQGYSPVQAAKSLGVDPASLRGWIKQFVFLLPLFSSSCFLCVLRVLCG